MRFPTMRQSASLTAAALTLTLAACGGSSSQINPPSGSSDLDGKNYEDVVTQFKSAGFTNVSAEADPDLVVGLLHDDGDVEEVSIDGDTDFESSEEFDPAVKVVIRYHTFKDESTAEPTEEASAPTTTSAPTPGATPTRTAPTKTATPTPTPTREAPAPATSKAPSTLTPENNTELAALLTLKDPMDPSVAAFAKKYAGQTIEFDGCVTAQNPDGSSTTSMVNAGDFDPNSSQGPNFHFTKTNLDDVTIGDNVHVTAKVGTFNDMQGLLEMDLVAISKR